MSVTDPSRDPSGADPPGPDAHPIPSHPDGRGAEVTPVPEVGGVSIAAFTEVLRERDFRLLFWGQAVSALGDWVGTLAFIAAAQQLAPDRPAAVAVVLVLRLLPSFFATPLGGVLSDRLDRKAIMVWSDLIRFGIILLVPFLPSLGILYALAFAQECFSLIFLPARDASLPNLVRTDRLEAANALVMGSSFAGIPLSGPVFALLALAGANFPTWMPLDDVFRARPYAFAFVFDAITFVVSAAFIQRMSAMPARPVTGPREPFLKEAREGGAYIMARPLLRGLAFAVTLGMLGGGVLFSLGIFYVKETLEGSNVEFGWLMGLFGAGMVAGFLVSQLKPPKGIAWMVRIALLVMGGVLVFMAVFPQLWIGYLMAIAFGLAFSVAIIVAMSTVQARSDDEHRGRVMGAVHMLYRAALSIGALGAAGLATVVPERGIDVPLVPWQPDKNQFALLVAGGLIAAGSGAVRGAEDAA